MFLDSTKSSLNLEFNRMKCSAKRGLNIGLGHRQLRNGPFWVPELLFFGNRFVSEMLGAAYGLSREFRVRCFVWYLQKLDFLD